MNGPEIQKQIFRRLYFLKNKKSKKSIFFKVGKMVQNGEKKLKFYIYVYELYYCLYINIYIYTKYYELKQRQRYKKYISL